MADKLVYQGNCYVTMTHPDGRVEHLGSGGSGDLVYRSITVTDGGQTIIERPDTGMVTIVPPGAKVQIEKRS